MAERFTRIALSELQTEEGYSITLAGLTSSGRVFVKSNAINLSGDWVEVKLPPELNLENKTKI